MAKRSASSGKTGRSSKATPTSLRRDRDRLEKQLIKLLNQHAKLTHRLGEAEAAEIPALAEKTDAMIAASTGPLPNETLTRVIRDLQSAGRQLVDPVRVAYLGPLYSYSFLAAQTHFGGGVDLVPVTTIAAVFDEVLQQRVNFGVVPLENSTDGRIVDTLDMFARQPVGICAEIPLAIHHNLLATCSRAEICEVYSKPQAFSQCREWIAKHLPGVRLIEMTSTAAAAQLAADRVGAAAVASQAAGSRYGLSVVAKNIEDRQHNVTRFAVIGDGNHRRTGKDKTALMFEIAHRPGSLADTMAVFKRAKVNLTWIESFPMPDEPNEYLFFVELHGHQADARVKKALASLSRKSVRLDVLGSYPRSQLPD